MITSKLSGLGNSIVTNITLQASEAGAIDLALGVPQTDCPSELPELVYKYIRNGNNHYSTMEGFMPLREKIAEKTKQLYGKQYNPEKEICITNGALEGIYAAITAFVREEDEVIVFEPSYDTYVPTIKLNGGVPVFIQLKTPEYTIDWEEVSKCINARTKMIIVNFPHNPTGSLLSNTDIERLTKLTAGSNIVILSDEVYQHIIFDEQEFHSMAKYPKLAERSIIVSSFGKILPISGWKTGYCIAPELLMKEVRKIHQLMMFSTNTPIQMALNEYFETNFDFSKINRQYRKMRDFFTDALSESNFQFEPTLATTFQLLDYSKISKENDKDFAMRLVKEFGVSGIPLSPFYHQKIDNKVLRFCFARPMNVLEIAVERLLMVK